MDLGKTGAAKTVDVLIPVYRPDARLDRILERLRRQTYPVRRIRIVNTERAYFDAYYHDPPFAQRYPDVEVRHITAGAYDHGGTRHQMAMASDADVVLFLTDDALPLDAHLVEHLVAPIASKEAAAAYARQYPRSDVRPSERLMRRHNYPARSRVKTAADIETMGIQAFFCPNVCAAYDRRVYEEVGGFPRRIIFNEDMVYAHRLLMAGHAIAYVADARVLHSHRYTPLQQLHRNFDLGVSHAMHPEVFATVSSEGEGMRAVREAMSILLRRGQWLATVDLIVTSGCKYVGYFLGKHYQRLPGWMCRRLAMNRGFFGRSQILNAAFNRGGKKRCVES